MNDQPPMGSRADDHAPFPAPGQPPYAPPSPHRPRSFFWPLVLITVGVVWLLVNFRIIAPINLAVLFRLWPVILIAIGLDILFGRRWPALGALIGLGLVALVVALLVFGPAWGLAADAGVRTQHCAHPVAGATSARVNLDLSAPPAGVTALSDSANLIDATFVTQGEVRCDMTGEGQRTVRVHQAGGVDFWFYPFSGKPDQRWDIGLSPSVPLELSVNGGSGQVALDLMALQVRRLDLNAGSGHVDVALPESPSDALPVTLDSGSGAVTIKLPARTDMTVEVDAGSGNVTFEVPAGAAVRVDVRDSGSGSVRVPGNYERTAQGDDDEGTWQTGNFNNAERSIVITVKDLGSGSIYIR